MIPQVLPTRFYLNPAFDPGRRYGDRAAAVLNAQASRTAFQEISAWPGYAPTPLHPLPALAGALDLRALWYKDEGTRFGLNSFKALGGMYGVFGVVRRAVAGRVQETLTWQALASGRHAEAVATVTVTCASLGNHGRSVARGAALCGCRAVIFLPDTVATMRREAIAGEGAEIRLVDGTYEDAVVLAQRTAESEGWFVVSDTAYPGYEEVPGEIMQGYTVMVREALETLEEEGPPTHVFVQAGVGGMAAAITGYLWERFGPDRPLVVVVEPAEADSLFESALSGRQTPSRGSLATTMSCLACRDASSVAWRILEEGARAFVTVPDYAAEEIVTLLASGFGGDPVIRSQPSGVAGLAGVVAASFEPALARPLALGRESTVLVFGSEGPGIGE